MDTPISLFHEIKTRKKNPCNYVRQNEQKKKKNLELVKMWKIAEKEVKSSSLGEITSEIENVVWMGKRKSFIYCYFGW